MDNEERLILSSLEAIVRSAAVAAALDAIAGRTEQRLHEQTRALMAWETVPLDLYETRLPETIRSSWVFVLRAGAATGAERHPNSRQRMMSYRGSGDLQTGFDPEWHSHLMVSDAGAPLEKRWLSIPPNVWHQAVVPGANWTVVSFHTVPARELIEERTDPRDLQLMRRRTYLGTTGN